MSATTESTGSDVRDTFAVRGSSRLATLLLVVAIGLALFEIGSAVVGFVHGREVTFQGSVAVRPYNGPLPSYIDPPAVADVTVHIRDASAKQQTLALVRDLAPIVLFGLGMWLLRGLLVSVRRGDPFSERNVWRLRGIGALLILVLPVDIARHSLDNALAATVPDLHEWPNGGSFLLTQIAAGLVVLALAEVFAYGVRLREDVEGTV